MPAKKEFPTDVTNWFKEQAASLWPAALGSISLRRTRCIRQNCEACRRGEQHSSHVLYGRIKGRRFAVYVPDELVPEVNRCLENGREFQELLHQSAVRYVKALKHQRNLNNAKAKK
jgi:hypothetical protein